MNDLRSRAEALREYCAQAVTDYDGAQMAEGEQPRIPPSCRDLRSIASLIDALQAECERLTRKVEDLRAISNVNGDWNAKFLHAEGVHREELARETQRANALQSECSRLQSLADQMHGEYITACDERDRIRNGAENVRLYAALYRGHWLAKTVLRMLTDGGVTGSPLRENEHSGGRGEK